MISFALSVVSDRLQALTRALDADATLPGYLVIYGGNRPASGAGHSNSALARLTFLRPSLDNVTQSILTLRNPLPTLVSGSGLATWARMFNGAGQFVADVDVGVDDEDIIVLDQLGQPALTAQLYAGGELSVSLLRLVEA
jgi:hypothetical protein